MKTRIEISCTEDTLSQSLFEAKAIIAATDLVSIELKIFHDKHRLGGHSWLTITNQSNPHELYQIYELKKKIAALMDELEKLKAIPPTV
jgi:uncharacterized small protein (DUF1192 family)